MSRAAPRRAASLAARVTRLSPCPVPRAAAHVTLVRVQVVVGCEARTAEVRGTASLGVAATAALVLTCRACVRACRYQYIYGTGFLTAGGAPLNAELLSELSLKPGA